MKGKTYFALSCIPPVYVIDTEFGAAQLAKQFPDKDIRIAHVWELGDDFETDPITCLANVDMAVESLSDVSEGTIVIDSGTDLWKWIQGVLRLLVLKVDKTANVRPSDYAWANAKYASVILRLLKQPVNFVITARAKPIYTSASLDTTGELEPQWQKDTPHFVDFVIRMDIIQGERYGTIEKCRFTKDTGKSIKELDWDKLYERFKDVVE